MGIVTEDSIFQPSGISDIDDSEYAYVIKYLLDKGYEIKINEWYTLKKSDTWPNIEENINKNMMAKAIQNIKEFFPFNAIDPWHTTKE